MTDKEAIAGDWKRVGDDMCVAMGLKKPDLVQPISPLKAFLEGVTTLNIFGAPIKHR